MMILVIDDIGEPNTAILLNGHSTKMTPDYLPIHWSTSQPSSKNFSLHKIAIDTAIDPQMVNCRE